MAGTQVHKTAGNIGAFRIRTGFGVYYTIIIARNPPNPLLIIKAPTLLQENCTAAGATRNMTGIFNGGMKDPQP